MSDTIEAHIKIRHSSKQEEPTWKGTWTHRKDGMRTDTRTLGLPPSPCLKGQMWQTCDMRVSLCEPPGASGRVRSTPVFGCFFWDSAWRRAVCRRSPPTRSSGSPWQSSADTAARPASPCSIQSARPRTGTSTYISETETGRLCSRSTISAKWREKTVQHKKKHINANKAGNW